MDLVKENRENKRRFGQSVVCGVITVIAVCALVVIASFIELPTAVRIALIVLAVAVAVAGIAVASSLDAKAGFLNE